MNFRDERHPVYGTSIVGRVCRSRRAGVLILSSASVFTVLGLLAGGR